MKPWQQHLSQLGVDVVAVLKYLPEHLTLSLDDGVLSLQDRREPQSMLAVDYLHGAVSYRGQQHLGGEHLIKACQIKGRHDIKLLDATCGLGTDSFLLHQAGFQVIAVEQNPVIHALLSDGLQRYAQFNEHPAFELLQGDVKALDQTDDFAVIYLDPMFPSKTKSAKNKKTMHMFQMLHAAEDDQAGVLLDWAIERNCQRVVIKRPTKAPWTNDLKPTFQVKGKTCRFDAYQLA